MTTGGFLDFPLERPGDPHRRLERDERAFSPARTQGDQANGDRPAPPADDLGRSDLGGLSRVLPDLSRNGRLRAFRRSGRGPSALLRDPRLPYASRGGCPADGAADALPRLETPGRPAS